MSRNYFRGFTPFAARIEGTESFNSMDCLPSRARGISTGMSMAEWIEN